MLQRLVHILQPPNRSKSQKKTKKDDSSTVLLRSSISAKSSRSFSTTRAASNPCFKLRGLQFLNSATHCVSGTRHRHMEDFNVSCAVDSSTALFGVFDGHGGPGCSKFMAEHLPAIVRKELQKCNEVSAWNVVLAKSLKKCGKEYDNTPGVPRGAGAVGALMLVSGMDVCVAHVGDCGVVCSSPNGYIELTKPHRSSDIQEQDRIIASGGRVEDDRLMGVLSPSRAFGNLDLRSIPGGQCLISDCDVISTQIELNDRDEAFVIIASDGVWDAYSSDEAVNVVRKSLAQHSSASQAAKALATGAANRNVDDITCTVIFWKMSPGLPVLKE